MTNGELLLYGGIALMGLAVTAGIVAAVTLWISGKRLNKRMEREFGKKRR